MTVKGGGGVWITGRGWVGAGGSGLELGAEGAGLEGMDAESSGIDVGEGDEAEYEGGLAGFAFKAELGMCRVVSTQIATLESKVGK